MLQVIQVEDDAVDVAGVVAAANGLDVLRFTVLLIFLDWAFFRSMARRTGCCSMGMTRYSVLRGQDQIETDPALLLAGHSHVADAHRPVVRRPGRAAAGRRIGSGFALAGAAVAAALSGARRQFLEHREFDVQPGLVGENTVVDLALQPDLDVGKVSRRSGCSGPGSPGNRKSRELIVHLEIDILDAHDQPVQVVFLRIEDIGDGQDLVGLHVQLHEILAGEIFDLADRHPGVEPQAENKIKVINKILLRFAFFIFFHFLLFRI